MRGRRQKEGANALSCAAAITRSIAVVEAGEWREEGEGKGESDLRIRFTLRISPWLFPEHMLAMTHAGSRVREERQTTRAAESLKSAIFGRRRRRRYPLEGRSISRLALAGERRDETRRVPRACALPAARSPAVQLYLQ